MTRPCVNAPCPHLPSADAQMNHRCLTDLKDAPRPVFYFTALKYGHYLWLHGHAGRALLAITRALYADVPEGDPVLQTWPLPYRAIRWIAHTHPEHDFPGNPRISYQHQATRMRGPRSDLRRARAWAVWALICQAKPGLPADQSQGIQEPSQAQIAAALRTHGLANEAEYWLQCVADVPAE